MKKRANSPKRAPLTEDELRQLSVADIIKLKLTYKEISLLREINRARNQECKDRAERLKVEEEPIVKELREVGYEVESVWDLVNESASYSDAIPILLNHLLKPYSDRIREGIARALAVKDPKIREAWPILVKEYRKAPVGSGIIGPGETSKYRLGTKDGLACALSVAVTHETLKELIDLAKDSSNGESRILLLSALRRSKNPLTEKALKELEKDPELKTEITSWKK